LAKNQSSGKYFEQIGRGKKNISSQQLNLIVCSTLSDTGRSLNQSLEYLNIDYEFITLGLSASIFSANFWFSFRFH